jgi:DNA invertase Pin-like site-specific DNA recombinase
MRVAIYGRVSRHDKDQTPENQMLKLREFAERHGWSVVKEYSDVASGTTPSRPDLDRMLKAARERRFDAILLVRIDRLGRSVSNLKNIAEALQHYGVDLICTDQNIDTSSASGKLFFTLLSAFAEFELDVLRERTKDGLARARLQGKRIGRPRYAVSTEDILKLRGEGLTFAQIAERVGMSRAGVKKRLRADGVTKGVRVGP